MLLAVVGAVVAFVVLRGNPGKGHLDTALKGVTLVQPPKRLPKPKPKPKPKPAVLTDRPCWLNFGGNPQRTSARLTLNLGLPSSRSGSGRSTGTSSIRRATARAAST